MLRNGIHVCIKWRDIISTQCNLVRGRHRISGIYPGNSEQCKNHTYSHTDSHLGGIWRLESTREPDAGTLELKGSRNCTIYLHFLSIRGCNIVNSIYCILKCKNMHIMLYRFYKSIPGVCVCVYPVFESMIASYEIIIILSSFELQELELMSHWYWMKLFSEFFVLLTERVNVPVEWALTCEDQRWCVCVWERDSSPCHLHADTDNRVHFPAHCRRTVLTRPKREKIFKRSFCSSAKQPRGLIIWRRCNITSHNFF